MKRTPERVAWSILFAALFTCCALAVGVPTAVLAFVNNSTVDADINVKLQAGILKAYSQFETENDARVVSLDGRSLNEGSTVVVGPESVGLLTISDATGPQLTLQLYSNANVRITRARLPRFSTGAGISDFGVQLGGGRIQVLAEAPASRFRLNVTSAHGSTTINTPGSYSFELNSAELRAAVVDGQAIVSTADGRTALTLSGGERTAVSSATGITGVLPSFRNLIKNGHFQPPLDRDWKLDLRVDAGSTLSGTATVIGEGSNTALLLQRVGDALGWGRTGVTQPINEDVRDRRSLLLRVDFQIIEQEIPVCGGEGSECPFMVRIDYRTKDGGDVSRIQGFYGRGTPSSTLPDYIRANVQGKHVARRLGVPETFEWNLSEFLPEMQTIKSISIYAEGHQVRTQVNSVELVVQD